MKTRYILAFLTLFYGIYINAQVVHVTDEETGLPIERVSVKCESVLGELFTNKKGEVNIDKLKGAGKIRFSYYGYRTFDISYKQLEEQDFEIVLTLIGVSFDEIVISASRFEEHQNDVAQKIQVMRGSEIQNMNQTSMADVISSSGNVMVQKSQLGGGSPIIRGFETNKILMVVDGVRMNNAIYRGGHLQNIVTLDNSIMQRVELVYGPGSVVYGSDALGGVMHFYTKNPTLSTTDETKVLSGAYLRYSSAATGYAAHADVSVANKKFGSLTSFTYSDFGDLRQGSVRNPFYGSFGARPWFQDRINGVDTMIINSDTNLQIGSGYRQYDVLQKFMFKQSDKISHVVNFQYSTSSDIPRYDRLTQMSGGNPKYAQWYYGPQKRLFASYSLLMNGSKFFDHGRVILGYQNIEESRNTRRFGKDLLDHKIEKLNILTFNADYDKRFEKHELRYGLDAFYNDVNSSSFIEDMVTDSTAASDTRYPDGGSSMYSVAGYLTHTWEIGEKLILNDGIRLTNVGLSASFVDTTFFNFPFSNVNQNNTALNGNIGLIFQPNDQWRITAAASSGFRAPNVDDMGKVFESVAGSLIVPNPDLKPEYTYSGELGISHTIDKRVRLSAVGYYTLYKNALTVQPTTYNGQDSIQYDGQLSRVTSMTNAGEAYLYGIEGQLIGNISENFSIYGTINYTYGRIKTDTTDYPLDHIPPVFGKFGFSSSIARLKSEFFVNYSAWKRLEDYNIIGEDNISSATANGMPAWFTLNARFNYAINEFLTLQVACENILDQNYRVFASNISAPGRNFIITLRGNF